MAFIDRCALLQKLSLQNLYVQRRGRRGSGWGLVPYRFSSRTSGKTVKGKMDIGIGSRVIRVAAESSSEGVSGV